MSVIEKSLFGALLTALLRGAAVYSAEFEVLDRFSVDGYTVLRGSADIPGGSFSVGGSTLVVKDGKLGIGTSSPRTKAEIVTGLPASIPARSDTTTGFAIGDGGGIFGRFGTVNLNAAGGGYPTYIQTGDWTGDYYWNLLLNPLGGNVGIGTTNPTSLLELNNPTAAYIDLENTTTQKASGITFTNVGTRKWTLKKDFLNSDHNLVFQDASSNNVLFLQQGGNVGIGTTAPLAALDVGGTDAVKIPVGTTAQRSGSPASGMLRVNSSLNRLEYWDGYNWLGAYEQSSYITATGGDITTSGYYKVHTFTSGGTFTVTNIIGAGIVEYLIVGGGGGGAYWGGGGGAGGVLTGSTTVSKTSYSVTVGAGGSGKTESLSSPANGSNSTALGFTAYGGGGGAPGQADATFAGSGGSGGGGGGLNGRSYAGQGTNGQGTNGGQGAYYGATTFQMGGGGGGAVRPGLNAPTGNGPVGSGGAGGDGLASSISGSSVVYGGGGGGGTGYSSGGGAGGSGGGGVGGHSTQQGQNGTANRGGGGGGGGITTGTYYYGGSGGSGIVIIRYRFQ